MKDMKIPVLSLLCFGFLCVSLKSQELATQSFIFETGVSSTLISVSAGEVLEIYSYAGNTPWVVKDGVLTGLPNGNTSAFPARIVGPAEIKSNGLS